jgi:hypothetical protein
MRPQKPRHSFFVCFENARLGNDQAYGLLFIDPHMLACAAHAGWSSDPSGLAGRLDSPQTILNWINSQPGAVPSAFRTNDAREFYEAICVLAPCNLEHFSMATSYSMKNFMVGFQSPAEHYTPNWTEVSALALIWIGEISRVRRGMKTNSTPPPV